MPRPTPANPRAFTLVELLAVIMIIGIVSSLSLAGLVTARTRAKYTKTESTIRKIHEIIMPHYEEFLNRGVSPLENASGFTGATLVSRRRAIALELPDSWVDMKDRWSEDPPGSGDFRFSYQGVTVDRESTSTRVLRPRFADQSLTQGNVKFADSEALYAVVMYGGFANPDIVAHFRADEFSDVNNNGLKEFIDGWGQPIRFLRWAPGFVSRYQPVGDTSHDAFDLGNVDPLASQTLFPLVFSAGPDGEAGIQGRANDVNAGGSILFSYHRVLYDPWFVSRGGGFLKRNGSVIPISADYQAAFGHDLDPDLDTENDNLFSHSMSR